MAATRTKYKLYKGMTVGLNQPVYTSQYQHDYYTDCAKCKRKVSTDKMYADWDGSQKHMNCLSPTRLRDLF